MGGKKKYIEIFGSFTVGSLIKCKRRLQSQTHSVLPKCQLNGYLPETYSYHSKVITKNSPKWFWFQFNNRNTTKHSKTLSLKRYWSKLHRKLITSVNLNINPQITLHPHRKTIILIVNYRRDSVTTNWNHTNQWCKQDQILKTKTKITRPRPRSPEVNKGTCKWVNATVDGHSSDVPSTK